MKLPVKKAVVGGGLILCFINIFLGGPILSMWIAAQFSPSGPLTSLAFIIFCVSFGLITFGLVMLLGFLNIQWEKLVPKEPKHRKPLPWLESLRGSRPVYKDVKVHYSAPEVIGVVIVVLVVVAMEAWFLFLAGSPLPNP